MSRKSKTREKQVRATPVSHSVRAGIFFPVGRVVRFLKNGNYARRVSEEAAVSLAAILEFLTYEILDMTVPIVRKRKM